MPEVFVLAYAYLLALTAGTLVLGVSLLLGRAKGTRTSRRTWLARAFLISLIFFGIAGLLLDALGTVALARDQFIFAVCVGLIPGLTATLLAR